MTGKKRLAAFFIDNKSNSVILLVSLIFKGDPMTNILVAEDNEGLRRLIGIHLRRAGYQVTEAGDGLDALDKMEHSRVHLIVTDVMMPRLDGYGLVRELRSAGDKTPVLMLTVKDTLEDKRTGFHAGADDYLTKPVDFEELLLRVEALLRRCGMQLEGVSRQAGWNNAGLCDLACYGLLRSKWKGPAQNPAPPGKLPEDAQACAQEVRRWQK